MPRTWKSLGHAVPPAEGLTKAADRITELEAELARTRRLHEATQRTLEAQVTRVFSAEEVERAARALYDEEWKITNYPWEESTDHDYWRASARAALSAVGRVL